MASWVHWSFLREYATVLHFMLVTTDEIFILGVNFLRDFGSEEYSCTALIGARGARARESLSIELASGILGKVKTR